MAKGLPRGSAEYRARERARAAEIRRVIRARGLCLYCHAPGRGHAYCFGCRRERASARRAYYRRTGR